MPQWTRAFGHDFASNRVCEKSNAIVVCDQIRRKGGKNILIEQDEIVTVVWSAGEKGKWRRI
jgi:hypothetical protein